MIFPRSRLAPRIFGRLFIPCLVAAALFSSVSAAAGEIATHRALYRLSMMPGSGDGGVVGVEGGMSFEWGESCDGWTVKQRYVMRFQQSEGTEFTVTTDYVTWESRDGLKYRFNVKRQTDGAEAEIVSGTASLESKGGAGLARFDRPAEEEIVLPPGTLFPTEHSLVLMEKAAAGIRFDRSLVFDGSEVGGAAPATTVILKQRPADPGSILEPPLGPDAVWPMKIAFYAVEGAVREGEELPVSEMSADIQANGVISALTLIFEEATVLGTLERIEAIAAPDC